MNIKHYEGLIVDAIHAAEQEAARSNFQAAIYRLTDALGETLGALRLMATTIGEATPQEDK